MARSKQKKQASPEVDEDTEYVIEKIKAHKRRGTSLKYEIKWQGYDEEANTWEPEAGVKDCKEVLEEYWSSLPRDDQLERYHSSTKEYKKLLKQIEGGAGSDDDDKKPKSRSSPKKKKVVKVTAAKGKGSEKKRRASDVVDESADDDDDDEEEEAEKPVKKNGSTKKKVAKRPKKEKVEAEAESEAEVEKDGEEGEEQEDAMDGYPAGENPEIEWRKVTMDQSAGSWEDLLSEVRTVEQASDADKSLQMLCVWKKCDEEDRPLESWVPATIVRITAPQRMIDFYESNLKFRPSATADEIMADAADADEDAPDADGDKADEPAAED
ncbi:hypothetical protein JCM10212_007090 [Sporobolomyces blumeae]